MIALGFGGGTLVLGAGGVLLSRAPLGTMLPTLLGYLIATSPLFLLAALVAVCKSELWLLPEARALRLLTYRPWLLRPRVEEAPVSEYAGVRVDASTEEGGGVIVSLVTAGGESVPLREFDKQADAEPYAAQIASAVGLWLRGLGAPEPKPAAEGGAV